MCLRRANGECVLERRRRPPLQAPGSFGASAAAIGAPRLKPPSLHLHLLWHRPVDRARELYHTALQHLPDKLTLAQLPAEEEDDAPIFDVRPLEHGQTLIRKRQLLY